VLKQHERVADALVVGVADARFGERVVAVVAAPPGCAPPELDELQTHARKALAGYKLPRGVVAVDAIPRNRAGKGDYAWARDVVAGARP
jgi:acyl-CoA synthetase (AMP-forming)/AMP-acid ligase II